MATAEQTCRFTFDGESIEAKAGQTIGGALHATGRHVLSRSFKYHRPRGLFCVAGRCPNCLCTVDGEPNVRICTRPAEPGQVVTSQNRWPSLGFDVMAVFDRLHRLMPVGFYYKTMHKPRVLWPVFESVIRRIAGLGKIDRDGGDRLTYDKLNLFTHVAVVGGGWAGLHAALEAANAGLGVVLIDEQPALGGHLRHDPGLVETLENSQLESPRTAVRGLGQSPLSQLVAAVEAHENIHVLTSATVFGCYEERLLGIQCGNRLIRLRAEQVIFATGGWERPFVFENNDLPGNLLAGGAQRLLHLDGCRFDGPAVVVTDQPLGYRVAAQLAAGGTPVAAVIDLNGSPSRLGRNPTIQGESSPSLSHTADGGATPQPTLRGKAIVAALGRKHVTAAVIEPLGGGPRQTIPCRWIVQAVGFNPASSLLYQSGCTLRYDPALDQPRVTNLVEGVHAAGCVNGTHDPELCAHEGRLAGIAAAAAIRPDNERIQQRLSELMSQRAGQTPAPPAAIAAHYCSSSTAKKKFVCLCEDVTEKDIADAIAEGFSNIETLKRYSTVSMGPCQGKMCQAASIALCARQMGRSIEQTGTTTARPPEQPVPLGVLAGRAVRFSVVRRTAMHDCHVAAGATFMDAGAWKRPERYGDPAAEYHAVRHGVGLIDVSTLGKIELRGSDVVQFLEFIYPSRFANLKTGRVRYGVICDEAGIILDDGTISRLGEDRFLLTTTTGNADGVDSWFRWWLAARPQWDVRLTNVTSCYAGMNLAGPRSREVLAKVCPADLSNEAFGYLGVVSTEVAGVPAIVMRIGFVGELGYEMHVPTQYGRHVWEALMSAGQEFAIRPFGVEAQRRLRLDKKHIILGADTNALSNPLEADLPWIVKLDKPDFIGRGALSRAQDRGLKNRLVGFRMDGNNVPEEASLVIHNGRLGGRVTSARFSPAANATVGLAWVPAELGKNGETFTIQLNGQLVPAVVQDEPFYDPAGERMKA